MTNFFFGEAEDVRPKRGRIALNPRPIVPNTGWKRPTSFPDLSAAEAICLDLETKDPNLHEKGAGWGRGDGHIIGVALATNDGFKAYYPIRHEEEESDNFDPATVLRWTKEQLSRPHQTKVGHNLSYDIGWLKQEGVDVVGPLWDTWVAERLIEFRNPASLEAAAQRHLGEGKKTDLVLRWINDYYGKGLVEDDDLDDSLKGLLYKAPPRLVGPYAEQDTALPLKLVPKQAALLSEYGLMDVFEMECDLLPVLMLMRFRGVRVNTAAAEEADDYITGEMQRLNQEIRHHAKKSVSATSAAEVAEVLTGLGYKLPLTKKSKKPSVTDDILSKIDHPFATAVSDYRELAKFQSTFIRGAVLEAQVKGVVHGTFNQLRAITGRMSSSDPNLQNIPSRNEKLMKMVRGVFIPWEGHACWEKDDYSSIESRLLAHFATGRNSEELREEYRRNPFTDYHNFTTALVKKETGLELPRKAIKQVNFSIIYGAGEEKLSQTLKLSKEEVGPFFEAYHSGMPYVKDTMESIANSTSRNGYTRTILGRRVNFNLWEPRFYNKEESRIALPLDEALTKWGSNLKRAHLHKALNYTIQGSAADLMKKAMLQCYQDGIFDVTGLPMLVVHDELDFSVRDLSREVNAAFREMRHIMENAIKFSVPIKVEGERGPNWGTTEKLTQAV